MSRMSALLFALSLLTPACVEGTLDMSEPDPVVEITTGAQEASTAAPERENESEAAAQTVSEEPSNDTPADEPVSDEPVEDPTPQCAATEDVCGGVCTDILANDDHCGGCGNPCGGGSECRNALCECPGDGMLCGGTCVDVRNDNQHCGACDNPCAGGEICSNNVCVENTEVEGVLQATNQARISGADCGVYGDKAPTQALIGDPELHKAAQAHADDMAANNFFSHTGSDGSSFSVRVGRTDYAGFAMGENIAAGQRSPESAVSSWISSDGHCRNLMNPSATKIGIGFANGGPYGTLWVQVFGR